MRHSTNSINAQGSQNIPNVMQKHNKIKSILFPQRFKDKLFEPNQQNVNHRQLFNYNCTKNIHTQNTTNELM